MGEESIGMVVEVEVEVVVTAAAARVERAFLAGTAIGLGALTYSSCSSSPSITTISFAMERFVDAAVRAFDSGCTASTSEERFALDFFSFPFDTVPGVLLLLTETA